MSQCFTVNSSNDIFIGSNGNLSISNGIDAVLYGCANAAKAQLAEMIYAYDKGVANFQTIWRNSANVAQFEASVRAAILSVEGVTGIKEFTVTVQNNICAYTATIETIYGTGTI